MNDLIILGTGCAGLTAAIYAARANLNPLLIEGTQPGGQLTVTSDVENFPGFPESISGSELMDKLRKQAKRFGAEYAYGKVDSIDFSGSSKQLKAGSKTYEARAVIIATGAAPRMLGVPGEKEMFGGKGVSTCATCDGAFYRDQDVVVVGGGDSACEEALFLTRFCRKVYLIHRRDTLRASKIMADRAKAHEQIEIIWDTLVQEVLPDDNGKVCGIQVVHAQTQKASKIACTGVFVAIGHIPNTEPFKDTLERDDAGYLITDPPGSVKTAIPGIYAAGDCVDHVYRQAITAAGMGCQAAIEAERWLAESAS